MLKILFIGLAIVLTTEASSSWLDFLATPFGVQQQDGWMFLNMSSNCTQEFVKMGGFSSRFVGDATRFVDRKHANIAILKWHCAHFCNSEDQAMTKIQIVSWLSDDDAINPANVNIECKCSKATMFNSIDMHRLHVKWKRECAKRNVESEIGKESHRPHHERIN